MLPKRECLQLIEDFTLFVFYLQHTAENRTSEVTLANNTNILSTNMSSLSSWFNLSIVLNDTPGGKAIMKYYGEEGRILPKHKKTLNKLILNKTFSIKDRLTVPEREEIAQQISLVFHNEESVWYTFFLQSTKLLSFSIQTNYFGKEKGLKGQILTGTLQAAYSYRRSKMGNKKKRKRIDVEDTENDETETKIRQIILLV